MDYSVVARSPVTPGLAVRLVLAGGCALLLFQIATRTQLYATSVSLGGLTLLILWDGIRHWGAGAATVQSASIPLRRDWHQQQDRAMALLDAVTVALISLASDGRITFANRAARLLAGSDVARLEDIPALGVDAAEQILALPAGARQIVTLADGRLMLVWVVGFSTPGQKPEKLVSLQAVSGELDAVQLRAWQDMTRILSHEIMNSLTPIASLSESVADLMRGREDAAPEVARAVQAIARRSLHLIDFVERYRQVAELPEPCWRPICAREFVANLEALLQADFAGRGISFRSAVRPGDLVFGADTELLSQAMLNLLRNAAEAVASVEQPVITLTCDGSGGEFACIVADNGPGISRERLQEIFLPFFTTKEAGSGIGLTLARQIALAHGGRLEVQDNPGGGALFRMTLPTRK